MIDGASICPVAAVQTGRRREGGCSLEGYKTGRSPIVKHQSEKCIVAQYNLKHIQVHELIEGELD